MKKSLFFVIIFILVGLIGCIPPKPPQESDYTIIKTGDIEMIKRIGEEFDIKVSIENAVEVVGLNAWITYDPSIVEVVDDDPGAPNTQVIATDLGFLPNAQLLVSIQQDGGGNEQPGTLICGYASIPAAPTSGTGDAFSVRFRAIAQGTTDIDFAIDHVNLQDVDGDIPTDTVGDEVEVPINATVRITVL